MKKFLVVWLALVVMNSGGFGQVGRFQHLVGTWQIISDQDQGGSLEIIDSSTIVIKFLGEEKKLNGCKIDFSKSPYWFDFSAKDTTTAFSNFKSLLEFVNDDTMRWQVFTDEERADHFTSQGGELFYLKRMRSKPDPVAINKQ
jgi:hypothetical protein